ncbi:hypothetical protein GQ55_6G028200 [Panicum hallii var. hallii]|uniref:Uncharacterized protein n=1 Tax=Panicum hallii var. hallii TaxID=1504633 RepID=A0A2T7D3B4_9POAL|nr:hypothetical protein GQ55_6G028200 [Panicum hallii var. hallii]
MSGFAAAEESASRSPFIRRSPLPCAGAHSSSPRYGDLISRFAVTGSARPRRRSSAGVVLRPQVLIGAYLYNNREVFAYIRIAINNRDPI